MSSEGRRWRDTRTMVTTAEAVEAALQVHDVLSQLERERRLAESEYRLMRARQAISRAEYDF